VHPPYRPSITWAFARKKATGDLYRQTKLIRSVDFGSIGSKDAEKDLVVSIACLGSAVACPRERRDETYQGGHT